jgi:sugar/nucleoside kinase (ribokinase family)
MRATGREDIVRHVSAGPDRPDVVVVGDVMFDVSVQAEELARGGDVHGPVLVRPGGTVANAAVWAAREGASVRLHAAVGGDAAGSFFEHALRERGVEPALTRIEGGRTGAMLVVVEEGERSMVADRGANAELSDAHLPQEIECGALLVSGYTLLHATTTAAGVAAIRRARTEHIAVDAASWPLIRERGPGRFLSDAEGATMLLANEKEAEVLGGADDAAARLATRFPVVVIKRGARGAVLARGDEVEEIAAAQIEERDATGAGDAFDGVLLARLALGDDLLEAVVAANRVGAAAASSDETWPT